MPIIRMRPRERTKSWGRSWPAGVAGTCISPSPAPVAALPAATWWVSLWVSTPATTQGPSPGSVPGARPGGVCHHDDAPSSWWARRSGPSRQDVDGAPPSSYQVTWGLDRRRCVAGRPGRGQDRDQGRPPGPPVKFRVTRPRRAGTYILHVQICHKGAPRRDRRRTEARNINASSRALRLDTGLCGRFGQTAPPRAPGGASWAGAPAGPTGSSRRAPVPRVSRVPRVPRGCRPLRAIMPIPTPGHRLRTRRAR